MAGSKTVWIKRPILHHRYQRLCLAIVSSWRRVLRWPPSTTGSDSRAEECPHIISQQRCGWYNSAAAAGTAQLETCCSPLASGFYHDRINCFGHDWTRHTGGQSCRKIVAAITQCLRAWIKCCFWPASFIAASQCLLRQASGYGRLSGWLLQA